MEKDKAADADVLVTGQARDLKLPVEACLYEKNLDPCIIVIFGASGDLAGLKTHAGPVQSFSHRGPPFSLLHRGLRPHLHEP